MKRIAIVIVATNAYFVLGVRFIRRFVHFYKGDHLIKFYFFSDTDPKDYVSADIEFIETHHNSWVDGTNSKFSNMLKVQDQLLKDSYVYYFDADTNIDKPFTEDWFLGDLVGGEHYGNRAFPALPFERNERSKAYVPKDTHLKQTYYYGAFFGGLVSRVLEFCKTLVENQLADREWGYEPGVNDESYINQYFHFNEPTKTVPCTGFQFLISDKGGLGETRNTKLETQEMKEFLLEHKDELFDIKNGKITTNEL